LTVETRWGPVVGTEEDGVRVWRGIPYALAPEGERRFAPPEDPKPWTEPRDATRFGPMSFQVPLENDLNKTRPGVAMSEDSLNLNVWAPTGTKAGDALPVYVFIHGGGFGLGSGSDLLYDGAELAKEGIIVVTFNYRLGAAGFLASKETFRLYGTTGNWGILDQIKALEWVRNNIRAFGGDPDKVTVGGESAGSVSVSALLLSPPAQGLFRGAIMESGTILALENWPGYFSFGEREKAVCQGALFLSALRLKDDGEGLKLARALDPELLAELSPFNADFDKSAPFAFLPVKDGKVIPEDAQGEMARGNFARVKILIGFNLDEGSVFVSPESSPAEFQKMILLSFGPKAAEAFWKRFPPEGKDGYLQRAREAVAYSVFSAGTKRLADLHSRRAEVHLYRFSHAPEIGRSLGLGAYHSAELPMVFGNLALMGYDSEKERRLGADLKIRFANFIKNGDPNEGASPPTQAVWPLYDPRKPLALDLGDQVEAVELPDRDNLDFMADLLYGPLPAAENE
jgi:para-nitrobenzyl esterase